MLQHIKITLVPLYFDESKKHWQLFYSSLDFFCDWCRIDRRRDGGCLAHASSECLLDTFADRVQPMCGI